MADTFSNQPIVIDNGSGTIKAGFAGSETPKLTCPAYVGRPKHVKVMAGAAEGEYFMGERAQELRGLLKLNYPTRHGVTTDWKDMQLLWQHVYSELNVPHDQHPVLLTEPPLNPTRNRAQAAEIFFETFNVPALSVQTQSILSLYAFGRTTGVVLDSGDGVTSCTPVYEGFTIPHAVQRMDVAGRDVTEYLQLLLRKAGHVFHTSAEFETVKAIKEKCCRVVSTDKEMKGDKNDEELFQLPDGHTIAIGPERKQAPEILFNPMLIGQEYMGVHQMLVSTIARCDLDIRRAMFSDIILAGGSTMFEGFGDRLLKEVSRLAPKNIKIQIWAPPNRTETAWIGGSILASLATFKKMWVTKRDYEENGRNLRGLYML